MESEYYKIKKKDNTDYSILGYNIIDDLLKYRKEFNVKTLYKSSLIKHKMIFFNFLNKDSNWVTFFIKSIIQDSAKKGYEKKYYFLKGKLR